jgi:uncharacterized protein CbrC (UPF0167 family)
MRCKACDKMMNVSFHTPVGTTTPLLETLCPKCLTIASNSVPREQRYVLFPKLVEEDAGSPVVIDDVGDEED